MRSLFWAMSQHPDQFDAERGEVHYRQAVGLAAGLGMHPLIAHCHNGLGKVHLHTGKRERPQDHAATAATIIRTAPARGFR
jgi:hypothetical protein